MSLPGTHRKSVTLGDSQLALIEQVRTPGTPERLAVEKIVGALPHRLSESQAIAQLVKCAQDRLRATQLDAAYATYAASESDEDAAFERATRQRRAAREAARSGTSDVDD